LVSIFLGFFLLANPAAAVPKGQTEWEERMIKEWTNQHHSATHSSSCSHVMVELPCLCNALPPCISVACTCNKREHREIAPGVGKRQRDRLQNLTGVKLAA